MENSDKLLVPSPVGLKKERYFKTGQIIIGAISGCIAVLVIIVIIAMSWYDMQDSGLSVLWTLIKVFIVLCIEIKILRKYTIKEDKLFQEFIEFRDNQVTDLSNIWGIRLVSSSGKITYVNGKEAVVVHLKRGSSKGQPPEYKAKTYTALTDFYTELLGSGYSIVYYSNNTGEANIKPLKDIAQSLTRINGTKTYDISSRLINYQRDQVKDIPMENEYLLVYSNGGYLSSSRLTGKVEYALELLSGSLFEKSEILGMNKVYDFCRNYHRLDTMNTGRLNSKYTKGESRNLIKVIDEVKRSEVIENYDDFEMTYDTTAYEELLESLDNVDL